MTENKRQYNGYNSDAVTVKRNFLTGLVVKDDLFIRVGCKQLGPQLQAVHSLPAVHLPEGILGAHSKRTPQKHRQLPDS